MSRGLLQEARAAPRSPGSPFYTPQRESDFTPQTMATPSPVLLEPRDDDPVVHNATALAGAMRRAIAENSPVSLHLIGHFALGELPRRVDGFGGLTLLPWLSTGHRVTLWSAENATLDAEGAGRIFLVGGGGQMLLEGLNLVAGKDRSRGGGCGWLQDEGTELIVRDSRFVNCSTTGVRGGSLYVFAGSSATVSGSSFEDCSVHPTGGTVTTMGGGVSVEDRAALTLTDTRCERTRAAHPGLADTYGGAVGVGSGMLHATGVTFIEASAEAESGFAWGGGLGMQAGSATLANATWERTSATSNAGVARGGGLGINGGGTANIYDSHMRGCRAAGAVQGAGGSIYSNLGGFPRLFNVTLEASHASHLEWGAVLRADPQAISAALLTIRQVCTADEDATTRLIATHGGVGRFLLRRLSLETNCTTPLREGTTLLGCEAVDACAAQTTCTMTNDTRFPTPSCACQPPSEPTQHPFLDPAPSPDATRPELAPYAEGCLLAAQLPPEQLTLQENWWRASPNTTDARACDRFWRPGQPTPCRGGGLASDYCWAGRGLSGPLCRVCIDASHHYDASTASCVRCAMTGGGALTMPIAVALGAACLGAAICLCLGGLCRSPPLKERLRSPRLTRWGAIVPRLGLIAKLKIALSYYQVVLVMPELFSLSLPPEYFEWMSTFAWINLDWFALAVAPECVGDYHTRLIIKALGPLVPIAALVGGGALVSIVAACRKAAADGSAVHFLEAAKAGALRTLPATLAAIFALVPSISARIFSTFSCEPFTLDDASGATRSFLYSDAAVECGTTQHEALTALASGLVVLWPVGAPALFGVLLFDSRGRTASSALPRAVAFLHTEYRDEYHCWELLELMRKLTLTGFLFLVDQQYTLLRLTIALLLSLGHHTLLQAARPYKQASTGSAAVATSMLMLCTLFVALLVQMYDELPAELANAYFGFESVKPLAAIIFGFAVAVIVLVICLSVHQLSIDSRGLLRLQASGRPPMLSLAASKRWHLFLSHNWANQDAVATIKRQLQLLLPGVSIFLDVDDLEAISELEAYVMASQAMLVFLGSAKYLESPNCMRELAAAKQISLPLVCVNDADPRKNGTPLASLKAKSLKLERSRQLSRQHTSLLFHNHVIPWHRVAAFQLNALAAIAEQMLLASPAFAGDEVLPLYIEGGLAWAELALAQPLEVYVSPHNPPAAQAARVLSESLPALQLPQQLPSSLDAAAARWLLWLSPTCFDHEQGKLLAAEVASLLARGATPVLLWSPDEGEFGEIIERTPEALRAVGLYGPLAIEWRDGVHRRVSVRLVARALGVQIGSGGVRAFVGKAAGACGAGVAGACSGVAAALGSARVSVGEQQMHNLGDGDVQLITHVSRGAGGQ